MILAPVCPECPVCVPCAPRLDPRGSFYRLLLSRVSRVCPGSPRFLFTGTFLPVPGTVYDQNCSTSSRLSVVVNLHVPACASCKGITVCELHLGA